MARSVRGRCTTGLWRRVAAEGTGFRFASQVGFGADLRWAATGQRLLVFGLAGAPLGQATGGTGSGPPVSGALVVDGAQESLPAVGSTDGGPIYLLASVPANA